MIWMRVPGGSASTRSHSDAGCVCGINVAASADAGEVGVAVTAGCGELPAAAAASCAAATSGASEIIMPVNVQSRRQSAHARRAAGQFPTAAPSRFGRKIFVTELTR